MVWLARAHGLGMVWYGYGLASPGTVPSTCMGMVWVSSLVWVYRHSSLVHGMGMVWYGYVWYSLYMYGYGLVCMGLVWVWSGRPRHSSLVWVSGLAHGHSSPWVWYGYGLVWSGMGMVWYGYGLAGPGTVSSTCMGMVWYGYGSGMGMVWVWSGMGMVWLTRAQFPLHVPASTYIGMASLLYSKMCFRKYAHTVSVSMVTAVRAVPLVSPPCLNLSQYTSIFSDLIHASTSASLNSAYDYK